MLAIYTKAANGGVLRNTCSRGVLTLENVGFSRINSINIYHKGCGTMGVPVFASENIKLTFAINFKKEAESAWKIPLSL